MIDNGHTAMRQHDNPHRRLRTLVRCCALVVAVILLLPVLPWPEGRLVVPAVSVFVGIVSTVATHTSGFGTLVALPVLVLVLVRRRWFCRWVCSVGLLTECAGRMSPASRGACKRVPAVGQWVALLSVSAAVAGYPLLLWLDPMAIFSGTLSLVHDPAATAAQVAAAGLAVVLILSAAVPGVWCLKLCPLGGTQELLAGVARALASGDPWTAGRRETPPDETRPTDSRTKGGRTKGGPKMGTDTSPVAFVGERPESVFGAGPDLLPVETGRRAVLVWVTGGLCALLGAPLGWMSRVAGRERSAAVLRPPGAVGPPLFSQLCLRCGNCVAACPTGVICARTDSPTLGDWLTPVVSFQGDYCHEDCCNCMKVCPSGAITRGGMAQKLERPIGTARIDMNACLLALGRECRATCIDACPFEAMRMHEWSWEDDRRYPMVRTDECPGCGACVLACTPMDAIAVIPRFEPGRPLW